MGDFPECEQLQGRLRSICRGEAGLSPEKTDAYRRLWGITSDNVPASPPDQKEKPAAWNPSMPSRGLGDDIAKVMHAAKPKPRLGPGGHLKSMLSLMGLSISESCRCSGRSQQMDQWGAAGCRKHRAEIIDWLTESSRAATWTEYLTAGTLALKHGLPTTIAGLVDEAIRRSEP